MDGFITKATPILTHGACTSIHQMITHCRMLELMIILMISIFQDSQHQCMDISIEFIMMNTQDNFMLMSNPWESEVSKDLHQSINFINTNQDKAAQAVD